MTTLRGLRMPDGGPGWLAIDGDRVVEVGSGAGPSSGDDLGGAWVLPGFIDIHCHGGGGATYTSANAEQFAIAAAEHLRHGTTTTNASLVSADHATLVEQIQALIPAVDAGVVHGIHLEGPWISAAYCGAHDPAVLRPPDPDEVAEILRIGDGRIAMVTIAPELPGALESIRLVREAGAIAAVGHTAATADDTRAAIEAGATVATHLFNAMPPLLHRAPGPVGALLADERVAVELICDLVHLSPEVVALAMSSAGGRCLLVSDAMAAAGIGDGDYRIGDLAVRVHEGEARLASNGSLAGSTLLLDRALRNAVQGAGRSVAAASEALSATPARILGLADRGTLAVGSRADLVVLDDDLGLVRVMRAGEWI